MQESLAPFMHVSTPVVRKWSSGHGFTILAPGSLCVYRCEEEHVCNVSLTISRKNVVDTFYCSIHRVMQFHGNRDALEIRYLLIRPSSMKKSTEEGSRLSWTPGIGYYNLVECRYCIFSILISNDDTGIPMSSNFLLALCHRKGEDLGFVQGS